MITSSHIQAALNNFDYVNAISLFSQLSNNSFLKDLFGKTENTYTTRRVKEELSKLLDDIQTEEEEQEQDFEKEELEHENEQLQEEKEELEEEVSQLKKESIPIRIKKCLKEQFKLRVELEFLEDEETRYQHVVKIMDLEKEISNFYH